MSTRAAIVRPTGEDTWEGRYHHWDGYPSGLGKTLYGLYRTHFKRDVSAMLTTLIDAHPAGWSTINNADFTQAPGFGVKTGGPTCYCHGERAEEAALVTSENAADSGCEWAYKLDATTRRMTIYSSTVDGRKMVGAFGTGNPDAVWVPIAVVPLDGPEPDWESFEG